MTTGDQRDAATRKRVLIVDDDPLLREILGAHLRGAGFAVSEAGNGIDARDMASKEDFSLLVLDLGLPGASGFEVLQHLRQHPRTVDLPVIVATSSGDQKSIERAYQLGASSFVTKPINMTQFLHHAQFVIRSGETERNLRIAEAEAKHVSRMKNGMFNVLSHELKTPLVGLIGMSEVLIEALQASVEKEQVEQLQHITDASRRINGIVSDILVLSKAISGKDGLTLEEQPLDEVIEDSFVGLKAAAREKEINIKFRHPLEQIVLKCDSHLLQQAVRKLIDNAIKFSPKGSPVEVWSHFGDDKRLTISVRDNGPGIPSQKLDACLQPFVQDDMSYGRPVDGLGLGLPIAKAIVEAHGGELVITNNRGRGLVAAICLPCGLAKEIRKRDAA
jgi:signal transduction histidine kinase